MPQKEMYSREMTTLYKDKRTISQVLMRIIFKATNSQCFKDKIVKQSFSARLSDKVIQR